MEAILRWLPCYVLTGWGGLGCGGWVGVLRWACGRVKYVGLDCLILITCLSFFVRSLKTHIRKTQDGQNQTKQTRQKEELTLLSIFIIVRMSVFSLERRAGGDKRF